VEILFKDNQIRKICNRYHIAVRRWGEENARLLRKRMDEIRDSENLAVLMSIPPARCHPLKGSMKGKYSVDLKHPYRLIFAPAHDPLPELPNGGLDCRRVTIVKILGKEDTHGN